MIAAFFFGAQPVGAQVCGNGDLEYNEVCDDGNLIDGDGCDSMCQLETPSCIDDVTGVTNNCTANDVRIALLFNESGNLICEDGGSVTVHLIAELEATSAERWDIGMFVALDGGAARTGICFQDFLDGVNPPLQPEMPNCTGYCSDHTTLQCLKDEDCPDFATGESCTGGYNPGTLTLEGGNIIFENGGPFYDGECSEDPNDVCGDLQQGVFTYSRLPALTVPCDDSNGDGFVDIGSCVSWDNTKSDGGNKPSCLSVRDTVPNTKAKCKCETVNIANVYVAGHIIVEKVTDPSGDEQLFDFDASWDADGFQLADGQSKASGSLTPTYVDGTLYSVSETVPSGWIHDPETDVTCVSDDVGSPTEDPSAIDLGSGETVTCTFTNTKKGKIIVEKQTVPDGDPTTFDFTGDVTDTLSDGQTSTALDVEPGVYTSTETSIADWDVTEISCDDSESDTPSTGDLATATATFNVDPGETVTCTFTNTKQTGTLRVIKDVINDNGGTATAADFSLHVKDGLGAEVEDSPAPGSTTGTDYEVLVGDYVVSEDAPITGYEQTGFSGDCDEQGNITVGAGETVTCTITNDDIPPQLTLVKEVTNDNGGTAVIGDWTLSATGTISEPTNLSGPGGATSDETFMADTYTLSESEDVEGYEASAWSCVDESENPLVLGGDDANQLVIGIGEKATCTITNDDIPPQLTLVKEVTNDNGGTAVISDWTLNATGTLAEPTNLSGPGGATSDETFMADTYTLSESEDVEGYEASAWSCVDESGNPLVLGGDNANQLVIGIGEKATCTITNDDIPPQLTLVKEVVNDNGGTAADTDWTLSAAGAGTDPTDLSGTTGVSSGETFKADTYTLSESGGPDGYDDSDWVCEGDGTQSGAQITLGLGEVATCTITNDDIPPSLTLVKEVENDNGGSEQPSAWTLTATGPTTLSGSGPTVNSDADFDAGEYTLSESEVAGYEVKTDWACTGDVTNTGSTITLGLGESATCTIVNTDIPPQLTVIKHVINDDGGTAVASDFTMNVTANNPSQASFAGAESPGTAITLDAGSYSVDENAFSGYSKTLSVDCSGTISIGESKTCTITNDDIAPTLTLVKTVENNYGGTLGVSDFPLFIDTTLVTSGVAESLSAGTYTASETQQPGYTAGAWGGDCAADGTVTLAVGENKTCTITNSDVQPTLTVIKHVINDNGGIAVASDFTMNVTATNPSQASFAGAESPGTTITLDAGSYSVDESAFSGYSKSLSADCSGTIAIGDTKTCTITNDDIAPTLKLVKSVTIDNGGVAVAGDWTLTAAGGDDGFSDNGDPTVGVFHTVTARVGYILSESTVPGYLADGWSCDGGTLTGSALTLDLDQDVTCTITNDDIPTTVDLTKSASPSTYGEPGGEFTFTLTIHNTSRQGVTITNLTDTQQGATDFSGCSALIGTFLAADDGVPGGLDEKNCTYVVPHANAGVYNNIANVLVTGENGIQASDEDDETVTVTNVPPVIDVVKTANPTNVVYPGDDVTFTVSITNNSTPTDPVTITSLVDDIHGDLNGQGDCSVPQTIQPGDTYTCSFVAYVGVDPPDITGSETDTVTASGEDDEGSPASDFDDATVIITPPIAVTDSALCIYDVDGDPTNGRQWRNIFTQDVQNFPDFKLNATNRGQTFYNLSVGGSAGDTVELALNFPWPFVTQGAQALHGYDGVTLYQNAAGETCFCPGADSVNEDGECVPKPAIVSCDFEVTLGDYRTDVVNAPADRSGYTQAGDGSWSADQKQFAVDQYATNCTMEIPASGFVYFNQHLDFGLKGPDVDIDVPADGVDRYQKHGDDDAVDPATITALDPTVLIPELADHEFCVDVLVGGSSAPGGCDEMYNDNEFKKNPGVAGRVTVGSSADGESVTGALEELFNSEGQSVGSCDGKNDKKGFPLEESECPGFDRTDSDGWWQIVYKHLGKPADYTIDMTLPKADWREYCVDPGVWDCTTAGLCTKQEPLKGNAFSEVNLEIFASDDPDKPASCTPLWDTSSP